MSFEPGYGTVLKIGDGDNPATATFTAIAQVTKIGSLGLESKFSEYVQHGGDGFQEKIPTIQLIGDLDLELGYDSSLATHAVAAAGGLVHAWANKTKLAWQLVFSDGGDLDVKFVAYVGKVEFTPDPEKHVAGKITLTPTGGPTLS
jgi:hypothetical protein